MAEAIITSGIIFGVMVICAIDWVRYAIHDWKVNNK